MYEVIKVEDLRWNMIIDKFKCGDIYFTAEYFKSSLLLDEGEPILFYYTDENGSVAYPFLKRKINNLNGIAIYDITTPYGYGGPLIEVTKSNEDLLIQFNVAFKKYCLDSCIVSEFIRFHPVIENYWGIETVLETRYIRNTIAIDLQKSEDLFATIPSKTRNMIRKAKRNNLSISKLSPEGSFSEFVSIYSQTMRRNNAIDYYFFDEEYFKSLFLNIGENLHMFGAYYQDKLVSVTLVMSYGKYVHYHLSGALKEYLHTGANNLLLFEIANWAKIEGYQSFHLGGGYQGNDDSLYKFKKSFTKDNPLQFWIGKKVYDKEKYDRLVLERKIQKDNGYFPLYRS
ncbi:GNAT family N-acetyltransferase [Psychrobacillus sp. PGGUH221]|uniref:lipid II:glycine glycyltransferase FemX n=1 Tax=Psychrobacillus sp. PGGUH221 TaxID=3020058 RepID=UPI0035C71796